MLLSQASNCLFAAAMSVVSSFQYRASAAAVSDLQAVVYFSMVVNINLIKRISNNDEE